MKFLLCFMLPILGCGMTLLASYAGDAESTIVATQTQTSDAFWTQDTLTGNWGGFRDTMKKDGITFMPSWIGEVFGNPVGGARQGTISDGYFNLPLDINLDPLTQGALKDTIFHVNAFYLYGTPLSNFIGDFSNSSNASGYNTVRLDELWAQKLFWSQKLSVKIGNMDVSNEFFRSNSASLFINNTFGAFTLIGNNIVPDLPVFPLAAPGVRIQISPDPRFYVMAGVFGLDNGAAQNTTDKYGTLFTLNGNSGMLVMSEVGFLLNQQPNDKGLVGSYRLGSFLDTNNFVTDQSKADFANGTGPLRSAGPDWGIYGVVDQQIYSQGTRNISLFTRAGGAPSNINFVDYYVDGGFNFTGFLPGRDSDVAGLAIARSHVSQDYSYAQVNQGSPSLTAETVLEATYKVQIAPWWSIQPDFQYYVTPSGAEGSHNAVVIGCRSSVQF